jgi:hypothetical protein
MKKKVIGLIIITIMLIVSNFSGCFENDKKPTVDSLLDQIKTNFINFFNNVTSYKFNKTGGIRIIVIDGTVTEDSVTISNTTMVADISKQSLRIISNYTNPALNLNSSLMIYIKDSYKYSGEGEKGNISWEIDELTPASAASNWVIYSNLDQYIDQMTNEIPQKGSDITWKSLEDETLDNDTYYVLQREHTINNTDPKYPGFDLYRLYHTFLFNKTDYRLYKVKVDIQHDIRGTYYTGGIDQRYVVGQDIFTFYDYNVPVKIELPPELL